MSESASKAATPENSLAVLDAHRRRWHDLEVFLAAQLRILREQQSEAALALAFCDLQTGIPEAATFMYLIDSDGAPMLVGIKDKDGRFLVAGTQEPRGSSTHGVHGVEAVLLELSRMPVKDRLAFSVRAADGSESMDIDTVIRRTASRLTRRKPDPEFDPMTHAERKVIVAAASEGFDAYSARLAGEWGETDEELQPIQEQQERLAAILGTGT
ncbi:MAG TPA: hypothetical protein VJQ60_11920 [Arthrobacter sp.]|nr:hypothetical protein [Arthrobacter sp.]